MDDHTSLSDGYGQVAREGHQIENDKQLECHEPKSFSELHPTSIGAAVLARDISRIGMEVSKMCELACVRREVQVHYEQAVFSAAAAIKDLSILLSNLEENDEQPHE
jgi:hypothetical protein